MKINIVIDDELVAEALKVSGIKTKRELITLLSFQGKNLKS